jgi:hypothetical protein
MVLPAAACGHEQPDDDPPTHGTKVITTCDAIRGTIPDVPTKSAAARYAELQALNAPSRQVLADAGYYLDVTGPGPADLREIAGYGAEPTAPTYDGAAGTAVATAPYDPYSDPSFMALMAQLDAQETGLRTQAGQRTQDVSTQLASLLPRIAERGIEQRRGVNGGAAARGVYRGGARLRDLAIQQRGEQQQVGDAQGAAAKSIAGIQQELDAAVQALALERAQRLFEATSRAV